jgi:predicted DNA-binding transcriptional regulator YafY
MTENPKFLFAEKTAQVAPGWTPKEGETVLINTTAIPQLLGHEATVLAVNPKTKQVIIQVNADKKEYRTTWQGIVPKQTTPPVTRGPVAPRRNPVQSANQTVNNAILMSRNIAFDYVDLNGVPSQRDVEPHYTFQARGTGNELLLSKDWKMRGGDWRTFRVEAMVNEHMTNPFVFEIEETLPDVKKAFHERVLRLKEQYPDRHDFIKHASRDNLYRGLKGYKNHLLSLIEEELEPPHHKRN